MDTLKTLLLGIYGEKDGSAVFLRIRNKVDEFAVDKRTVLEKWTQKDAILITYGDSIMQKDHVPLQTLTRFLTTYLKDVFSTIHILPFYPFSSDDGFSVTDFFSVDPHLGNWEDVDDLTNHFNLMADFVLNHVSAQSGWFRQYLNGEKGFEHLAIEADPAQDLSGVTRPRALPLLSPFKKTNGDTVHVWTTFSTDQIDLNYHDPNVLEKMIDVMLHYVGHGATILRLDAIAYLFKKIGTPCVHLKETHDMVKIFRRILDHVAPGTLLLTETNVPHEENIGYFGNGRDEAHMVYNFTLPPLLLYTFVQENATLLSSWAKTLCLPAKTTTFFNFTASHDGIGVRPLEGILSSDDIEHLAEVVRKNGGRVSYKRNPDGTESPYELNITFVDALKKPGQGKDPFHARRFLASQAIQYVLPGIPATYIHSVLGSRNWAAGVAKTGMNRTINREKLSMDAVIRDIDDSHSFRSAVFYPYVELIRIRQAQVAFHPNAGFSVLDIDPRVFAVRRARNGQTIIAITNIVGQPLSVTLPDVGGTHVKDLVSGEMFNKNAVHLAPYRYAWLVPE